jgi:hypothetical protein
MTYRCTLATRTPTSLTGRGNVFNGKRAPVNYAVGPSKEHAEGLARSTASLAERDVELTRLQEAHAGGLGGDARQADDKLGSVV